MEMRLVGKVREAHGLKGDLYVIVFSGDISWVKQLKKFELRRKGAETGTLHEVQRIKPFKKGIIISTADISDRNASEAVEGSDFLIDAKLLVSKPGETIYLSEIKNFMVKDVEQKNIGPILDFSSNGAQDLLVVQVGDKKAEIPFVEAFIKKIDFKHQYVVMDLPEGILDVENL